MYLDVWSVIIMNVPIAQIIAEKYVCCNFCVQSKLFSWVVFLIVSESITELIDHLESANTVNIIIYFWYYLNYIVFTFKKIKKRTFYSTNAINNEYDNNKILQFWFGWEWNDNDWTDNY